MSKEEFNIHNFLKDIKYEITEEVKENNYTLRGEIDKCIRDIVENYLIYYDYIRDVIIISEFEAEIFQDNEYKLDENEGISSFLNRLAIDVLTQYLIDIFDIDEVEK